MKVFSLNVRSVPWVIAWIGVTAAGLEAQELSGRIRASTDSSSVAGALVLLVDSTGREVGRTLSTPTGGFGFKAPAPGTYQVRVLRIGYASWRSPPVGLLPGERKETSFIIEDRVIQLAAIEVRTTRSRCGVRPGEGDVIASLLNEAEKALAITDQTIRQGNLRFRTETWISRPASAGAAGERQTATATSQAMWPVASAPPESLARYGFVREGRPQRSELGTGSGPIYFAPDARVLFAPWFLDTHCFSVVQSTGDTGGNVVIQFTPANRNARRDIRGLLTLDRRSLELRSLQYWYTGLGKWVPFDSAGGRMSFRRLGTGAWVIDRWQMRAPIPLVGRRDTTLFGFAESGGQVKEIRDSRSGEAEKISRAVLDLPSVGQQTISQSFTLFWSDLCAHRGACLVDLSSFSSSALDRPRLNSKKWTTTSGPRIDFRPVPI